MEDIQPILDEVTFELKSRFGKNLISVVLFGGYGRKIAKEGSDVDLMIIANKLPSNPLKRDDLVSKIRLEMLMKYKMSIDFLLFTPKDVTENFNSYSPIFSTLTLGSKIVYDKDNFFKKNYFEFMKKLGERNIQYAERGTIWNLSQIARNIVSLQLHSTR